MNSSTPTRPAQSLCLLSFSPPSLVASQLPTNLSRQVESQGYIYTLRPGSAGTPGPREPPSPASSCREEPSPSVHPHNTATCSLGAVELPSQPRHPCPRHALCEAQVELYSLWLWFRIGLSPFPLHCQILKGEQGLSCSGLELCTGEG